MNLLEQAKALYERLKGVSREESKPVLEGVSEALREAYGAFRKDRMYDPENAQKSWEKLSPSGKYKLVVTSYTSGPGTWNVTEGKVFRVDSDQPIASIRRNYSSFPYLFIEQHANGHDFLIGGEDYQGQTVIELDTGTKRGLLPEEARQGHGFCWAHYTYHPETKLLLVDGCHWACPYEYRFYDFSDPMNKGWPQLELVPQNEEGEGYLDADNKSPTFEPNGTIVWYQTKYGKPDDEDQSDEEDDDGNKRDQRIVATRTFKREDLKLVEVASWVSDDEQAYRAKQEEGRRKWDEWCDTYRKTDPLYLRVRELSKETPFKPAQYFSSGVTHDNWCPDFKEQETRVCQEVLSNGAHRVEIEIAAKTGPVKLILVDRKKDKSQNLFFMEHTVESVDKAFAAARAYLGAS